MQCPCAAIQTQFAIQQVEFVKGKLEVKGKSCRCEAKVSITQYQ